MKNLMEVDHNINESSYYNAEVTENEIEEIEDYVTDQDFECPHLVTYHKKASDLCKGLIQAESALKSMKKSKCTHEMMIYRLLASQLKTVERLTEELYEMTLVQERIEAEAEAYEDEYEYTDRPGYIVNKPLIGWTW